MALHRILAFAMALSLTSGYPFNSPAWETATPTTQPITTTTTTPAPSAGGCTHTLAMTYSRLPTPPYWPWCASDRTESVYAATSTAYREMDCRGCSEVEVKTYPENIECPPHATMTTTTSLDTTRTEFATICSPTPTYSNILELRADDDEEDTIPPAVLVKAALQACPTTLMLPPMVVGPTITVFEQLVTVTSSLDCGGCPLVISTRVGGLGPINRPGVTATQPTGTETSYVCIP